MLYLTLQHVTTRFFIIVKIKLWSSGQDLSVVLYTVTVSVDESAASIFRVKVLI